MSKFGKMGLAVETVKRMTIMDPRNPGVPLRAKDGTEAYIEGHSADSEISSKIDRGITTARLAMRNRNKLTGDRVENEHTEKLAALTTGWFLVGLDGEPVGVEHSEANARDLFSDNSMKWLRDQWDEWTNDRGNFATA